jgi:hypothetical protein
MSMFKVAVIAVVAVMVAKLILSKVAPQFASYL